MITSHRIVTHTVGQDGDKDHRMVIFILEQHGKSKNGNARTQWDRMVTNQRMVTQ